MSVTEASGHARRQPDTWAEMWRRGAATAYDYSLVALWAGAVFGATRTVVDDTSIASPVTGQLLGLAALTIPATVALAAAEHRGGTPGKRLLGLATRSADGRLLTFRRSLIRTSLKVALPWELAHAGIWQSFDGSAGTPTVLLVGAAYFLLGATAVALWSGRRPWYDLIADGDVHVHDADGSRRPTLSRSRS